MKGPFHRPLGKLAGMALVSLGVLIWPAPAHAAPIFERPPLQFFLPTPTPTPTPTPSIRLFFPPRTFIPLASPSPAESTVAAESPTATPEASPPTSEETVVSPSPSETAETGEPQAQATPTLQAGPFAGIGLKEVAGVTLVSILAIIILLQSQWAKIKAWLHQKTA